MRFLHRAVAQPGWQFLLAFDVEQRRAKPIQLFAIELVQCVRKFRSKSAALLRQYDLQKRELAFFLSFFLPFLPSFLLTLCQPILNYTCFFRHSFAAIFNDQRLIRSQLRHNDLRIGYLIESCLALAAKEQIQKAIRF